MKGRNHKYRMPECTVPKRYRLHTSRKAVWTLCVTSEQREPEAFNKEEEEEEEEEEEDE
jgi:hypothetical protein